MRFCTKVAVCVLAVIALASPATASLQVSISAVLESSLSGIGNDFDSQLASRVGNGSLGSVKVVQGTISATAAGIIRFYAYGSESGFTNTFHVDGPGGGSYTENPDLAWQNDPGIFVGQISVPAGTTSLSTSIWFTTNGTGTGITPGPHYPGDVRFGIFVPVAAAGSYSNDELWFGYDDNGGVNPNFPHKKDDDNHDDLVIRAVFDPLNTNDGEVPEPASVVCWSLLAAGATCVALRRRRAG